jgi:hypothetical protein
MPSRGRNIRRSAALSSPFRTHRTSSTARLQYYGHVRTDSSCGQVGGKDVQGGRRSTRGVCTYFVQNRHGTQGVRISTGFSTRFSGFCAPRHPQRKTGFNRGFPELIPIVHSPNNKNYMYILNKFKGISVEELK